MAKPKKLDLKKISMVAEPLGNGGAGREACQICGLYRKCSAGFQRPYVPEDWTGKLLIVDEAPEHDGPYNPLHGPTGKLLRKLIERAKYSLSDIAFMPAVRCHNTTGTQPSMKQVRACRPFVLKVLEALNPENVLGLGATALRTLRNDGATNITKTRGKLIDISWLKV